MFKKWAIILILTPACLFHEKALAMGPRCAHIFFEVREPKDFRSIVSLARYLSAKAMRVSFEKADQISPQAMDRINQALKLDPDNASLLRHKTALADQFSFFASRDQAMVQLESLKPNDHFLTLAKAKRLKENAPEEALALIDPLTKDPMIAFEALKLRAQILNKNRRTEDALEAVNKAIEFPHLNFGRLQWAFQAKMELLYRLGRFEELHWTSQSYENVSRFHDKTTENWVNHLNLANMIQTGRLKLSGEKNDPSIRQALGQAKVYYYYLAASLIKQGRNQEALKYLKYLDQVIPESAISKVIGMRVTAHMQLGHSKAASKAHQRLSELESQGHRVFGITQKEFIVRPLVAPEKSPLESSPWWIHYQFYPQTR